MKQNSNVPAFLTKLWTLVEDADTNEFICWSQEGNSFLVLDEQRFAKEILPKYFKHNNMASFVRQLNMYGFRKVMHIDTGVVKQERDGPVEFQHPYFQHGQDDLLENIKRKVSSARPEDGKIRQEDLTKILSSMQNVHGKQESIDSRLATLKRENEALWREMSEMRQKHTHQQQLIKKLIQFIVTLVQNNRILNLKRTRPLMDISGKKPKYIPQIYDEVLEHNKSTVNGLSGLKNSDITDDVIICDVTDEDGDDADGMSRLLDQGDVEIVEVDFDDGSVVMQPDDTDLAGHTPGPSERPRPPAERHHQHGSGGGAEGGGGGGGGGGGLGGSDPDLDPEESGAQTSAPPTSGPLQLNKPSSLCTDDPLKMMDSILNEGGAAISQNINLLGRVELMDYLDSIDCSLEDFQALLYGKQFSVDPDLLEETIGSKEEQMAREALSDGNNTDKQLIQYTTPCPLLSFLDGCTPLPSEADPSSSSSSSSSSVGEQPPVDLLDLGAGAAPRTPPPRSSLIRLEPLTEAEASEATLFYLCDAAALSPDAGGQLEV